MEKIQQEISGVYKVNTVGLIEFRQKKICVCISIAFNKYFLINSDHREIYDDFEIASPIYTFTNYKNRFVCCSRTISFDTDRLIEKVGNFNRNDMIRILNKIQTSEILIDDNKESIITELQIWLSKNVVP